METIDAPPLVFRGRLLKARRVLARMTQMHAACMLGIATSTYRAYEQDRNTPPGDRVGVMAGMLGCSPADFYESEKSEQVA